MPRQVQMVRGATAAASAYVGLEGQLYVDLTAKAIRVLDGITPGGNMTAMAGNNLADLTDKAIARSNLSLGTAALSDASDFDVAGAAAAAQVAAEAYTDVGVGAINAFLNVVAADGADGYCYFPNHTTPAKPWLFQWKRFTVGGAGWTGVSMPGGSYSSSVAIAWPITFPNSLRISDALINQLVANGNFADATLLNTSTSGGTVFGYSGQNATTINGIAWGFGN